MQPSSKDCGPSMELFSRSWTSVSVAIGPPRKLSPWAGVASRRFQRHRAVAQHHRRRHGGDRRAVPTSHARASQPAGAATGRRAQTADRDRPRSGRGAGGPGRAGDAGRPESPLRWTCKSTAKLAEELHRQGHRGQRPDGGQAAVRRGLQPAVQPQDPRGQSAHPDRNAQFEYINDRVRPSSARASRWSRWTPRRRNWSGISRTAGGSGSPRANRKRSGSTTSRTRRWARRSPTGSTT